MAAVVPQYSCAATVSDHKCGMQQPACMHDLVFSVTTDAKQSVQLVLLVCIRAFVHHLYISGQHNTSI